MPSFGAAYIYYYGHSRIGPHMLWCEICRRKSEYGKKQRTGRITGQSADT